MPMPNIFAGEPFTTISLIESFERQPHIPGRAGQLIDWSVDGIITTVAQVEWVEGSLKLLNPTPRGGNGETTEEDLARAKPLNIPHYQHDDTIMADEVQNERALGSENQLMRAMELVEMRQRQHAQWKLDPTLEYQRIGALTGVILDASGDTRLDLFDFFEVNKPAVVNQNMTTLVDGKLRTSFTKTRRASRKAVGGAVYGKSRVLAGDDYWDALIENKEVRESYLAQAEASQLRGNSLYEQFDFAGITFENYQGDKEDGTPFIAADEARMFQTGVPGLWRTIYAPADYNETVNTRGRPRYSQIVEKQNKKGWDMESQFNAINYCQRPESLRTFKLA